MGAVSGETPLRMSAYYYAFDATGVRVVDEILSAVATAGKMYHNTDSWTDVTEWAPISPVEMIQSAANRAAESFRRAAPTLDAQTAAEAGEHSTPETVLEHAERTSHQVFGRSRGSATAECGTCHVTVAPDRVEME